MFTRQDYLDHQVSHEEYYSQFVTDYIKDAFKLILGSKSSLALTRVTGISTIFP